MPADFAFAAFMVFMAGALAIVVFLWWDARLQRRQNPGDDDAGWFFDSDPTERSDSWDATDADLIGLVRAVREQPERPLAALPDLPGPPSRWEQPMITPSPILSQKPWVAAPKRPKPRPTGPTTLQFTAIAKNTTGVEPELGPDEPTWVSWTAMELPLLKEIP